MNQRTSKLKSLDAVNTWTFAEIGEKKAKKIEKALIKRKRRTLEKREVERIIKEELLCRKK